MLNTMKKVALSGLILCATTATALAAEKPFVLAYKSSSGMDATAAEVKSKIAGAGFEIAGSYTPYAGAMVIAITNDNLKKAAASSEFGGYAAAQRVTLTEVDGAIQVSYTNPVYYGNAYRLNDNASLTATASALESALGKMEIFGTGEKELSTDDMRKFHYMFGMEYFTDPSELAEYDSYSEAVAAVESGLAAGKGGASKVYRIDIPGKDETVFGVGLKATADEECQSDEYIMSRVDKSPLRSTGHLPYEILVSGNEVYALYARFRIAISWPHLPMIASETGATFFNIMCAPNAIEEALIKAAGGEV